MKKMPRNQRQQWIALYVSTILLVGQAIAADQAQQAKTAASKAGAPEQTAATGEGKTHSSPSETVTKPEAQAVDPVGKEPSNDAITCLARTIYWEARGEGSAGMEAVANVVMNRLGHEGFPNTICGVVRQGGEQSGCQFSWWCDGRSDKPKEDASYAIAIKIAQKALKRKLTDRTGGALYFHQRNVTPSWSAEYIETVEVGEHVFYKPHGDTAR